MIRRAIILLSTHLLLLTALAGCEDPPPPQAPEFVLPSDGAAPCDLLAERPRLVFLLFWLHTCPYCREEVAQIHTLADGIDPARVVIYAVHVEGGAAVAAEAAGLMAHPNVRICWDDGTVSSRYAGLPSPWRLTYIPHMMWIDADGLARRPRTGVTAASILLDDMKKLLAETGSKTVPVKTSL